MMRIFTILILAASILSCENKPEPKETSPAMVKPENRGLDFTIQTMIKRSESCATDSTTCASVDLSVPYATGPAAADPINARITGALIEALGVDEVQSTGLEEAAMQFVASYDSFLVEMKADGQQFIASWAFETEGQILHRDSQYICVELPFYTYTGGAHPNSFTSLLNFDAKTGMEINILDLIKDTTAFKIKAEAEFRAARGFGEDVDLQDEGFFWGKPFFLPANIGIVENGLYLVYDPYEAAPYAAGPTSFVVKN